MALPATDFSDISALNYALYLHLDGGPGGEPRPGQAFRRGRIVTSRNSLGRPSRRTTVTYLETVFTIRGGSAASFETVSSIVLCAPRGPNASPRTMTTMPSAVRDAARTNATT